MPRSFDVKIWSVREKANRKKKSYELRWKVGNAPHSLSFRTKTLADGKRAELLMAIRNGEAFDEASGLPLSELRKRNDQSWYQHARDYMEMKWDRSPASTRRTLAEAMATVTPVLVSDTKGLADSRLVRQALYSWAFNVNRWKEEAPEEVEATLEWFQRKSVPTSELANRALIRKALDALTRNLDGGPTAATSVRRKRAIFHNALSFAVDREMLSENPLPRVSWQLPEPVEEELDPAHVPSPELAEELLRAVRAQGPRGRQLVAFFGCMLYAAARPAEVTGLKRPACRSLPRRGWGLLGLQETRPRSGTAWTDSGEAHDRRGLKKRSRKTVRQVPVPPELVALLRWHLDAYGTTPDGRLFRTLRGGLVQESGYGEVWARAREKVLTPDQFNSPLAKRPYDLRHAAVSWWLSSGVDPQTVAKRAGHSVAVLFRVYAKFIDDSDDAANAKISARLRDRGGQGNRRS